MKIRTKTKERLLSEGWEDSTGNLRKEGVFPVVNTVMEHSLGRVIEVYHHPDRPDHYMDYHGWTWALEMLETKEEQVLRILKEYESRRQGGN